MRLTAFLFCCFIFSTISIAQIDVDQTLALANESIKKENFKEAISLYESLLIEGYQSNDLHLNLGLAYYKNDDLAHAVLHFEKVLKKSPFDKGARTNLKIVNDQRVSDISAIPDFFLLQWWRILSSVFTSLIWSLLGIMTIGLATYFFYQWLFVSQQYRKLTSSILVFLLGILFLLAGRTSYMLKNKTTHLINLEEASIFVGPNQNSKIDQTIIAGEKLKILDEVGDWMKISLVNKEEGWINKELVKGI